MTHRLRKLLCHQSGLDEDVLRVIKLGVNINQYDDDKYKWQTTNYANILFYFLLYFIPF